MFINWGVTNALIKSMKIFSVFFTNTIMIYCCECISHDCKICDCTTTTVIKIINV